MAIVLSLLLGALLGHAIRRVTPGLLGLHERRMPFAWPWVELTGALSAVAVTTREPSLGTHALVAALLAVTATDAYRKLIPDRITFPGTMIGVTLAAAYPEAIVGRLSQHETLVLIGLGREPTAMAGLALGVIGAAVGFAMLEGFRRLVGVIANIEGMGMGDAKLLMMIGAFLGPHGAVLTILPACLVGTAVGVVHRIRTGMPHAPFGPALAAGGLVVALWGASILDIVWRSSFALLRLPPAVVIAIYGGLILVLVALMLRLRRRADAYREIVERDYEAIEADLEGRPAPTGSDAAPDDQGPV